MRCTNRIDFLCFESDSKIATVCDNQWEVLRCSNHLKFKLQVLPTWSTSPNGCSVARLGSVALDEDILSMPPMIAIANRFVLPVQSAALTPEFTEMVADELERDNLWTDSSIELVLSSTANRQIRRVFSYSETMNETIPIKEWWSPDWEGPRVVRHEDREYLRIRGTGNIKLNAFLYVFARLLPIDQDLEVISERIDEGNEDVMIGNALYLKASKRTEQFSRLSVDDEIKLSLQATLL